MFVCSLGFVTPCAAGLFAADANGPPDLVADIVVAASATVPASETDVPIDSLTATDSETNLPSALLLSDVSRLPERGVTREERVRGKAGEGRAPGGSLLRVDSLPGMLDSLLDQGILVPEAAKAYRALPGMSGAPPVLVAGSAPLSPARDGSPDLTWRETGFNVMRWTSAALAVVAVVGTVIVLVMPGLRRRMFFPELPPLPMPQP